MRRDFTYLGEMTEDGFVAHDREEVRQALLDLEGALYQLGGVVTISAVRKQIADGSYVTTGVLMAFDSYSPAVSDNGKLEEHESEEAEDGAAAAR